MDSIASTVDVIFRTGRVDLGRRSTETHNLLNNSVCQPGSKTMLSNLARSVALYHRKQPNNKNIIPMPTMVLCPPLVASKSFPE
jgi:hypothetical protein